MTDTRHWTLLLADLEALQDAPPEEDGGDLATLWGRGDTRVHVISFSLPATVGRIIATKVGKGHAYDAGWSAPSTVVQLVEGVRG